MSKAQRKAKQAAGNPPSRWATPTPEAYEGAGMEDLDAALVVPQDEPAPADDEPIDFSDPDAKAAWLDMLADAYIAGDKEQIDKLQAMIPDDVPTATDKPAE